MPGHNGYGATRRGSHSTGSFDMPAVPMEVALLADQVKLAAIELNCSPRRALDGLRSMGAVECDDAAADAALALLFAA